MSGPAGIKGVVPTVKNLKRTKIVATVGPATDDEKLLIEMMRAGLSVVRLNASHGTRADLKRRLVNGTFQLNKLENFVAQVQQLFGVRATSLPGGIVLLS